MLKFLHYTGKVPLPPYLNRDAAIDDETRYQTVFAKEEGSVAAPTAGLHFTTGILQRLREKNIDAAFVTLHVGAGTFMPVKSSTMAQHQMHAEWMEDNLCYHKAVTCKPYKEHHSCRHHLLTHIGKACIG